MVMLDAARSGDRRILLESMRDALAAAIDAGVEAKELPALVLRLERVSKELESLGVGKGGSVKDALAARRQARQTAAG